MHGHHSVVSVSENAALHLCACPVLGGGGTTMKNMNLAARGLPLYVNRLRSTTGLPERAGRPLGDQPIPPRTHLTLQ